MYILSSSKKYRNQVKKIIKNSIELKEKLQNVISILLSGESLPRKNCDHKLKGEYSGYRECHVTPDLLLVYKKDGKNLELYLFHLDSHSSLF